MRRNLRHSARYHDDVEETGQWLLAHGFVGVPTGAYIIAGLMHLVLSEGPDILRDEAVLREVGILRRDT